MKHLLKYKLFEKSSLTYLGVPNGVMVDIQKQFALPDDVQWDAVKYKKDLRIQLRRKDDKFFIVISENNIIVIFLVDNIFYVDNYRFYKSDDMGDEYWDKEDRIKTNVTEINKYVPRGSKIYKLIGSDWAYENQVKRKLKKVSKSFDNFTTQFKSDFAENFTKIVKNLYSKHSFLIQDMIMHNLINVDNDISPEKAKELLTFNVSKAKESGWFKSKSGETDPFHLQIQYIRDNSLTIFNEFLIKFENEMSKKYSEFLNIQILCDRFSRDKIMTGFAYYLYSGKLMNL